MFQSLTNQCRISIYLIKINEIELSKKYSDRDKEQIKRFYKKKIQKLNSEK